MLDTYTTQVISFTNMQNADNAQYCSYIHTKHSTQNLLPCNTSARFDSAFDQHVSYTTAFTNTLFDSTFDPHLVLAQLLLQPHNSQHVFVHNYFYKHNLIQHWINTGSYTTAFATARQSTFFLHNCFHKHTIWFSSRSSHGSCTTAFAFARQSTLVLAELFGSAVDHQMVLA